MRLRFERTAFTIVMFLAACASGDRVEPADRDAFCAVAANFDLEVHEELDAPERKALIRELASLGPPSLQEDFDTLVSSFDGSSDRDAANRAGERVGKYVQEQCPEVNLPGIRADTR